MAAAIAAIQAFSASQSIPTTPVAPAVAQLIGVRKLYGNVVALDGLDLDVRAGEVLSLLGPNGAGKTTAVRTMLGLTAPTSGTVRIFGKDPQKSESRTRTGAMLQVARVPETLKVREHINLFRSYYPKPLSLEECLRIANIADIQDRLFGKLSGGQKQRVLFAMAICGDPDMVFLDEPTVGLDIESRRALWASIEHLATQGKSVLLTTHYLEEADILSHRIAVINRGRVITQGTPAQIKNIVQGRMVRCTTQLSDSELRELPSVIAVSRERNIATLQVSVAEDAVRELLRRDATVSGLEISSAALEDAFLALTQKNEGDTK